MGFLVVFCISSMTCNSDTSALYLFVTEFMAPQVLVKEVFDRPPTANTQPTKTNHILYAKYNPATNLKNNPMVSITARNLAQHVNLSISAPTHFPINAYFKHFPRTSVRTMSNMRNIICVILKNWPFRLSCQQNISASTLGMLPSLLNIKLLNSVNTFSCYVQSKCLF